MAACGVACAPPLQLSPDSAPAPFRPLSPRRPADGTHGYSLVLRPAPDSTPRVVGTMTVSQSTLGAGGQRVVRRVITYDYGASGGVVDTTLSVASTLAPILERTRKSSGADIVMDFSGRIVTGRMGPDSARKEIRDTLATPAFNTTDLELVVRSLPLRNGYRASLPVYDPEFGGYRHAELRVDGTARGGREWVVRVRDRRLESVYRVDAASRALLGIDVRVLDTGAAYEIRRTG